MKMKIEIGITEKHELQYVGADKIDVDKNKKKGHSLEKEKNSGRSEIKSGRWYITRGNPTCYFNLDLGDGTTLQIPYPC